MAIYTNDAAITKTSYTDLPTAVTAIGSGVTTIYIPNALTISANLTIPTNITLFFEASGQITVNAGVTLTVNGLIIAPPRQIFFGTGTTTLSAKGIMYNEWTGGTSSYMTGTQGSWTLSGGGGGFAGTYTGPVTFTDNATSNINLTLSEVANQIGDAFRVNNNLGTSLFRLDATGRPNVVGNFSNTLSAPATPTSPTLATGGSLTLNQAYQYRASVVSTTDGTESRPSAFTSTVTPTTSGTQSVTLTFAALSTGQSLNLYRTKGGGSIPFFVTTLAGSTSGTWTYTDGAADTALGYVPTQSNYGAMVQLGNGGWDGSAGAFNATNSPSSNHPTILGVNMPLNWNGEFFDFQVNGATYLWMTKNYLSFQGTAFLISTLISNGNQLSIQSDFANRGVTVRPSQQNSLMWQDGILNVDSAWSSWSNTAHAPGRLATFDAHGNFLVFGGYDTSGQAAPSAPTLNTNSTTGGNLPAGNYVYYYSFIESNVTGKETPLSPGSGTITTTGTTSSVTININTTATPSNYRINVYRTNVNGSMPFYMTQLAGGTTTWTDTGTTNTGSGTGIVQQWVAPVWSASQGLASFGDGPWDGRSTGFFSGSTTGTGIAGNMSSGFTGNLMDLQLAGSSKASVTYQGNMTLAGTVTTSSLLPIAGTTTVPPLRFTSGTNLTTPLSGAVEYDGNTFYSTAGGASRRVIPATSKGVTSTTSVTNTVTETVIATITIPSNELNVVGRMINLELFGRYSTTTSAPTVTIRARLGTVTGTVLWNTTPTTFTPAVSASNWPFQFTWNGTVITTGATGTMWTDGYIQYGTTATAVSVVVPATPTAATGSLNLSGTSNIVITLAMGTANASNSFSIDQVFYTIA